jgi:uncharacterized protein (DUF302 family)
MSELNFKKTIDTNLDDAISRTTKALAEKSFGILTRIDMHTKIKEKIGKDMEPVVILGACNPNLAFEAYNRNSDVSALLPCNAVLREIAPGKISVELVKPSALMTILGSRELIDLASRADELISSALENV